MSGKPSPRMIAAMLAVVDEDIPPHAAALRFKLSPSTIYVSILYRAWKQAHTKAEQKAFRKDLIAWQKEAGQRQPKGRKGRI